MDPKAEDANRECSNYGCSVKFGERESNPVCQFHPGGPVFHEGYKFWGCCKKRVIDFNDFLNQKGCAHGGHCWIPREKPAPEVLKEELLAEVKEVQEIRLPLNAMSRPDFNSQLIDLKVEISPNFPKLVDAGNTSKVEEEFQNKSCQNSGCSVNYVDREASPECLYHPGEAIFHEGLKYWSCCKKKAMEFEEFLKQKGCTHGAHCWIRKRAVDCRFDWHQTGTYVTGAIYVKGYSPAGVKIQANAVRLQVSIDLPAGVYKKDWVLQGIIDEGMSSASLMTTKVEIKLKKAEPIQWTEFYLKEI